MKFNNEETWLLAEFGVQLVTVFRIAGIEELEEVAWKLNLKGKILTLIAVTIQVQDLKACEFDKT
jgi:hypothetical protein